MIKFYTWQEFTFSFQMDLSIGNKNSFRESQLVMLQVVCAADNVCSDKPVCVCAYVCASLLSIPPSHLRIAFILSRASVSVILCSSTGRCHVPMTVPIRTIFNQSSIFSENLSKHEKPLYGGSYEACDLRTWLLLALLRTLTWSEGGRQRKGGIGDTVHSYCSWQLCSISDHKLNQ